MFLILQFHFAIDMWEKKRVDGKQKLKPYAVPTIFGDCVIQHKNTILGKVINQILIHSIL